MPNTIERVIQSVKHVLWEQNPASMSRLRAAGIRAVRIGYGVGRDINDGQLTLQAMSLVYTTLLSLVPLLALSFSVLKAFGVHNQIEPLLAGFLAPLGDKGVEITAQVIGFVENIKVGVLGALGLGLLIYTVTSLVQKIERAFNYTWHVQRARPLAQQFSQYLSVLLVGPVLIFSAIGITGTLASASVVEALLANPVLGRLVGFAGTLLPYVLVIGAFTFVYALIPNTRVRLGSALVGGIVAGALWETGGWLFASFIAVSTKYTAIYAGFAILIMFMIWLYLSWLILLIGASIAFYHQHPEYLITRRRELRLSHRTREHLALLAMTLIGRHHYQALPPWTGERLAQHLGVPAAVLDTLLIPLKHHGLLAVTGDEPPRYLPAQPPETVPVKALLDAVRGGAGDTDPLAAQLPADAPVEELLNTVEAAIDAALAARSWKDLATAGGDRPAAGARQRAS